MRAHAFSRLCACDITLRGARASRWMCSLCLLMALALAGCSSGQSTTKLAPTSTVAPTATTAATATIATPLHTPIAGLLGPAPARCPSAPPLQTRTFAHFGGFSDSVTLRGGGPVWIAGFYFPTILHLNSQGYTAWPSTKIIWEIGPNSTQRVTITARNLETGALGYWFFNVGEPQAAPQMTLDPAAPVATVAAYHGAPEPGWQEWGSGLLLYSAGCYELVATWSGGSWRTIFAAGR